MVKFVGSKESSEDRRILETNLKPFTDNMRTCLRRMVKSGYKFNLTDLSDEQILATRKALVEELKRIYGREDREVEIAVKAMATWYLRTEKERQEAIARQW